MTVRVAVGARTGCTRGPGTSGAAPCVDDDECGRGIDVEVAGAGREPEDTLGVERLCTPRAGG